MIFKSLNDMPSGLLFVLEHWHSASFTKCSVQLNIHRQFLLGMGKLSNLILLHGFGLEKLLVNSAKRISADCRSDLVSPSQISLGVPFCAQYFL